MSSPPRSTQSWRALIISPSSEILTELSTLVQQQHPNSLVTEISKYPNRDQIQELLPAKGVNVCFIDTDSNNDHAMEVLADVLRVNATVGVIALFQKENPDFLLRCLRQGATDFLLRPYSPEHLNGALQKVAKLQPESVSQREPARVTAVVPAKGACGATTLASNLAYQWKRLGAKKILLCDLDPLTGTISFLLKIKSNYSFLDVMSRAKELDEDLWRAMTVHLNGVDVLLAPELLVEGVNELRDPSIILDYARLNYDVVILDVASAYGDWNLGIARAATEILLVSTNELPALQAAQRTLNYLEQNRIGNWKIKLVVNRYQKDGGLSRDVIGQALHREVFHVVPSDYEAVQRALMEGKPIPAGSDFGKAMSQLGDRLAGRTEQQKKSGSLGGLLGLFTRTQNS
jgi:pilus assembly protein CpaE